jgi:RNA polymerase sigma factor (TIGR02999 family)
MPVAFMDAEHDVTLLLKAWSGGEQAALDKLTPLVYTELRRLARRFMAGERHQNTLETAALVNEAYMRLVEWKNVQWQNRAHFFAVSAQIMRRILTDYARSRTSQKRGAGVQPLSLDEEFVFSEERNEELVALDEALTELEQVEPRMSRVVELRFFVGLTVEETAEVLKVSPFTVHRDWRFARAWLSRKVREKD